MSKKLPDPARSDVKGQESMFTDRDLWAYKHSKNGGQKAEGGKK